MTTLPYSPLTHAELNDRARKAREQCGYTTVTILRHNAGEFDDWAFARLRESGAEAIAYQAAAMARCTR